VKTALGEIVRWTDRHGQERRVMIVNETITPAGHAVEVPGEGWYDWPIDLRLLTGVPVAQSAGIWIPTDLP